MRVISTSNVVLLAPLMALSRLLDLRKKLLVQSYFLEKHGGGIVFSRLYSTEIGTVDCLTYFCPFFLRRACSLPCIGVLHN